MQIDGGCHCGHITYRADIDPERVVICHCTDCQALSGSAYRFVAFTREDALEILTGELKIYVKVADSGRERAQAFCPECGSAIYATSTGEGSKVYGLRAGTIVQRAELVPRRQIWHRSALNWVEDLRALPRTAEQ
ncbi:MAG: GFA family protein [Gammaproteobacteria bacterium]|nr:GFA family protein [Pseudomonadota bacterium]